MEMSDTKQVFTEHMQSPFMALASVRKGQTSRWKGKPGSLTLTLISNTASPSKSLKHFISSWAIHKQQHSSRGSREDQCPPVCKASVPERALVCYPISWGMFSLAEFE